MPASRHVLILLPPDVLAVPEQRLRRLPPQGAALVAALCGDLGLSVRVVDLERSAVALPLDDPSGLLCDDARLWSAARGPGAPEAEALVEQLVARVGDLAADAVLLSLERHTQLAVAALLGVALKRRTGRPVALGGQGGGTFAARLAAEGVVGVDVATAARTPGEVRAIVRELVAVGPGRMASAIEPLAAVEAPPSEGWPLPDFGVYDLSAYRQALPGDDPARGTLVLPYTPSFGCAFRCAFCQDPQAQAAQPAAKVVADLAALGERWGARDFLFLSCQLNRDGSAVARAVAEAGLDVRWSDSWRVAPSPAGVFEVLARGGCVGLTFGVESASRRVLQRMRKGHRPEEASRVVREAAAAEIFTRVNLLPCFPGETASDLASTLEWVRANGPFIDDLAPSSFYLDADSPIGRDPGRFGLRPRGARELSGEDRFRKSPRAATYDEVGGLSWEEREATLRPAEEALRAAWHGSRGALPTGDLDAVSMLLLRRRHATRDAAFRELAERRRPGVVTRVPGPLAPDRASLVGRLTAFFPPALRTGVAIERVLGALLVRFADAEGRVHVLEATRAAGELAGVSWAYRDPDGSGGAARFVGSYRRLFARFAPLASEVAALLDAPLDLTGTPGAALPTTPHVFEADLVAAALSAPAGPSRDAAVRALVERLALPAAPARFFLSLENPCDQSCEFCGLPATRVVVRPHPERFPPGRDLIDSGAIDAFVAALGARPAFTGLCLTGYDWTLHPRVDALLDRLERGPRLALELYGPSTRLADAAFGERALALPGLVEVRLTLHSPTPAAHDAVSRTPGSGARVLEVIRRARGRGVAVRVNAVLTRRTALGLGDLLAWAGEQGLRLSLLAFLPDRGVATFDGRSLLLPWSEVRAALDGDPPLAEAAIEELIAVPACAVPPPLRKRLSVAWNSPLGEGTCFAAACDGCRLRSGCVGVARLYADAWGDDGLAPER